MTSSGWNTPRSTASRPGAGTVLANANNRLTADGALIQGSDVKLIASNNLSASAGNDLSNSGLIQAGNCLDLLAGRNIVNKAGGVIAGRDVSLTATTGDVINERTVTRIDSGRGDVTLHSTFQSGETSFQP